MKLNINYEYLTPVIFIIGVYIYSIVKIILNRNKKKKMIEKLELEHPEKKEIIDVLKSKIGILKKRDKARMVKQFINFLVLILIMYITVFLAKKYNLKNNEILILVLAVFGIIVVLACSFRAFKRQQLENCFMVLARKKYGEVKKLPTPKKILILGSVSEIGNVRRRYLFSYKIFKYRCIVEKYYQEKLNMWYRHRRSSYQYHRINDAIEYKYNLKELGIMYVSPNLLMETEVQEAIKELSEIRPTKVNLYGENLIVERALGYEQYMESDVELDVNDVGLFYEKIVKPILNGKE